MGLADHDVIQWLPKYRQLLKRVKPRSVTVRPWIRFDVKRLIYVIILSSYLQLTHGTFDSPADETHYIKSI